MEQERLAVGMGVLTVVALVALAALPYALFPASSVGVYYGVGLVGPQWIALFGVVAGLTLVAGIKDRTDPQQAAGIAVTLGLFGFVLSLSWASPALPVTGGFDVDALFWYHPIAVAASALVLLASTVTYATLVVRSSTE